MIQAAKDDAETIRKDAEAAAFAEVKRKVGEAQADKQQAEEEAERIIAEAQQKAVEIEAEARTVFDDRQKEAEDQGRQAGREAGFAEGKAEVERLIKRTQVILERAQGQREEILAETEQQIIDLALLISRKVIKVISDSQRTVVIQNVAQALRKVKARGNILIRVNLADVKLTTEHIKDFIQMMEGAKGVQVAEDSSVDSGGCIIETDFGEIDARISSQLAELESKILELSPIKGRAKPAAGNSNGAPGNGSNAAGASGNGNGSAGTVPANGNGSAVSGNGSVGSAAPGNGAATSGNGNGSAVPGNGAATPGNGNGSAAPRAAPPPAAQAAPVPSGEA
ncbi:hypothetical protein FACS1894130_01620 [Spirochaetia bacterium]|nr:hypothetical protein FACS1894130_01620 [Spirochaetia bacterium]